MSLAATRGRPPESARTDNKARTGSKIRTLALALGVVALIAGGIYVYTESNSYETDEDTSPFPNTMQNVKR